MSNLVLYSIPVFVVSVVLEALWARRHPEVKGYELRDSAASMTMGLANVVVNGFTKLLSIPLFAVLYQHRIVDIGSAWWAWLVLLFAEDCCYYWFHRVHHEVRLLWACHVNHHSSEYFNFSTALRQPLLTPLSGPWFWAPLPLIGFTPAMVLTAQAWSLIYQFWLHTEAVDRLGPLEWLMNTPSHHRVHHGKNVAYLDKNHGGIFILWDRLFGTFAPEVEPVVYGLTKDIDTFHPGRIAFHEFAAIGRDVAQAPGLSAKLGYLLAPPGWSHDGSSQTATQLQRAVRRTRTGM
ncbi:MAG: sterol desaturase family protein [Deltaproteobacteria bacterium]|nr:MAG: sterol desaturase family protein [Deltaproteobacteria bacterium]TMQ18902.1 MAG: sterol desaturase family protein [Deltaproteobacteria bacterium]